MAKNSQSRGLAALLLLPLLLLASVISKTEAIRPLEGAELPRALVSMDRLLGKKSAVRMMSNDGPSPEGPGHRYKAPWLTGQSDENHLSPDVEHK
ncbi:hypothetical protein ACJRO7_027436 [Eucalyptus globulus]|uniref:Uncharacterized protein n=1 Tax=Eucalyptus globulus TaxID=34317 RepID=A0ABD3JWB5_EUCGL